MPPKKTGVKASAAAAVAGAAMNIPSIDDIASGRVKVPDEILQTFALENDLPPEQQAYYPARMDVDVDSGKNRMNEDDPDDVRAPRFSARDAILGEDCAFDEMVFRTSHFFGSTMNFVPGKNVWPVYRREEWPEPLFCAYDGYELEEGKEITMHPEEWTVDPNEEFKCWGAWCLPCWRRWLIESNLVNKGHYQLAQSRISIVILKDVDDKGYPAPSKYNLLKGWGGNMDIATYRAITLSSSAIPAHTDRLITDARFIPTPVVRQIDVYNRQLAQAHYSTADDFYRSGHITAATRDALLETMPQHAAVKVVDSGVWFDEERQAWMDIHNMVALEGNGPCLTPSKT